jgi:hypothetical protein
MKRTISDVIDEEEDYNDLPDYLIGLCPRCVAFLDDVPAQYLAEEGLVSCAHPVRCNAIFTAVISKIKCYVDTNGGKCTS